MNITGDEALQHFFWRGDYTELHYSQYVQCVEEFSAFGQKTTYYWNACHSKEGKDIYHKGGKQHFIQNKLKSVIKTNKY